MRVGFDTSYGGRYGLGLSERALYQCLAESLVSDLDTTTNFIVEFGEGSGVAPVSEIEVVPLAEYPPERMPATQSVELDRLTRLHSIDAFVTPRACVLGKSKAVLLPVGWQDLYWGRSETLASSAWAQMAWSLAECLLVESPKAASVLRAHLPHASGLVVAAELVMDATRSPTPMPPRSMGRRHPLREAILGKASSKPRVLLLADEIDDRVTSEVDLACASLKGVAWIDVAAANSVEKSVLSTWGPIPLHGSLEEAARTQPVQVILTSGTRAPLAAVVQVLKLLPDVSIGVTPQLTGLLPDGVVTAEPLVLPGLEGTQVEPFLALSARAQRILSASRLRFPLEDLDKATSTQDSLPALVKAEALRGIAALSESEY